LRALAQFATGEVPGICPNQTTSVNFPHVRLLQFELTQNLVEFHVAIFDVPHDFKGFIVA
jgi:hypothetical protein